MIPLLISILGLGTAVLLYVRRPARGLLRGLALLLLLLLALGAALRFSIRRQAGPPILLIDASQSMARRLAEAEGLSAVFPFRHQTLFFRDRQIAAGPVERTGSFTDLTSALDKVADRRPSAVVLITDGNHNYGPDPLSRAGDWPFPVYPVGIGVESPKDQSVSDAVFPAYVYRGDSTDVTAVLESRGFAGTETGRAILESADKKIRLDRTFALSEDPARQEVSFRFALRETGRAGFRVSIPARPDEADSSNNSYDFSIEVLPEKIRILYYTDHLSFNTRFLLPILERASNFKLRAICRTGPDRTVDCISGAEIRDTLGWGSFDVWILDDVDLRRLSAKDPPGFLNRGGGILFIGGIENLTERDRGLLPIPILGPMPSGSYPLLVVEPFSVLDPIEKYPPLAGIGRVIGGNPRTVTIARSDKTPVLGYAAFGPGLVFQINILDLGAWQFSLTQTKHDGLLAKLVPDIVRFLSVLAERSRLILAAEGKDWETGRPVRVSLQSYDRDLRPSGGGDFYLSMAGERIPFFEVRPHYYEAEFVPRSEGNYELAAAGVLGAESLRSRTLKIRILPRRGESEMGVDRSRLRALAERTGGRFLERTELPGLVLPAGGSYRESRRLSLDHPLVYFIVLILLALDWVLRRRRGTI